MVDAFLNTGTGDRAVAPTPGHRNIIREVGLDEATHTTEAGDRLTLLTIIYESGVDERVMSLLAELSIEGWTKLPGAYGYGGTGYKLDSPIWPGINSVLLIALTEIRAMEVSAALRALQQTYGRKPGITMWMQPITML